MNQITLSPGKLKGCVTIPPSKSVAHRAIVCAALSGGRSVIKNVTLSKDITATVNGMKMMGADITLVGEDTLEITGVMRPALPERPPVDCIESGSTLRFLIPLALTAAGKKSFTGRERLMERPLETYFDLCRQDGIEARMDGAILTLDGQLQGGCYTVPGNISSQYITGLLFALPLLPQDSEIRIEGALESRGYLNLTVDALSRHGVTITYENGALLVRGSQRFLPRDWEIEGDYSQAAFFLVADALGSSVRVGGLKQNSHQGDREIVHILNAMGCDVHETNGCYSASCSKLHGIDIDASQIPDLVPVLAVAACGAEGVTRIQNAGRLRLKESDRLSAITEELSRLGADITEREDSLIIRGGRPLTGARCSGHNDHRIAMSLAVASTICNGQLTIDGADCVQKSYGSFWDDYQMLGGELHA